MLLPEIKEESRAEERKHTIGESTKNKIFFSDDFIE